MFLSVHSATGLLIGQYVKNPLLAFLGGFILHYILDIIPHGDTKVPKKYHNIVHITLAGIFDVAFMTSYLLIFMLLTNQVLSLSQILAIIGSLIPDIMQLLYFLWPHKKILKKLQNFHNFFHDLITKKFEFSLVRGFVFQFLFFVLILIISL